MSITRSTQGAGRWQARVLTPAGKRLTRRFDTKVEAVRWETEQAVAQMTGQWIDPAGERVTVRAYAEAWRASAAHRPTTAAHVETHLRRHIYPTLGARRLAAVRPSEVQAWVKTLSATLAPSTVAVVHRLLAGIFHAAVADRLVAVSPCERTRLPKRETARVLPVSTEVVRALADAVPHRYRALVILAAGTGMRQGEALGLSLDRVDWLRRRATVDRQLILVPGGPPTFGPPKTSASVRTIPLPTAVLDVLAAHVATYGVEPTELLFTDDLGAPIRRTSFSRVWRPAAVAAGAPGVGMHALRHYYASLLIRHGESVKTVQARLGHASAGETLDTYSHLWPDSDERTREAIDAAWEPSAGASWYTSGTATPARPPDPLGAPAGGGAQASGGADPGPLTERTGTGMRTSQPVRRVLSPRAIAPPGEVTIHLGTPLPTPSSGLPGSSGEQPSSAPCSA